MADSLYELLQPHLSETKDGSTSDAATVDEPTAREYLERLPTLSLKSLSTTEEESLAHASQSTIRSLQALAKRSHSSITDAANHLRALPDLLSSVATETQAVISSTQGLEKSTNELAQKYERSAENELLDRRKTAALLNRNVDRVGNVLELPSLLASVVSASKAAAGPGAGGAGVASSGYASALDLHAHVKRLHTLYPKSDLIDNLLQSADDEITNMIAAWINSLQSPTLKLAVAMRTIGWLRRAAPELIAQSPHLAATSAAASDDEGALGALFLVCRLITLRRTLEALDPLKQLADAETQQRQQLSSSAVDDKLARAGGMQSERYLKRYIEVYREQSFSIVSMYKSIFPSSLVTPGLAVDTAVATGLNGVNASAPQAQVVLAPAPALASFAPELVNMLFDTLNTYLPNVTERASRDSLLSQVLFCAGSLGRLGADFGMMLALLEEEQSPGGRRAEGNEWVKAMEKHRVQASRLEVLASGVSLGRKSSLPADSGSVQSSAVPAQ